MTIRTAVITVGIAAAVLSALVLLQLAGAHARQAELLAAAAALVLVIGGVCISAAIALTRALAELRAAILSRARGDTAPLPEFGLQELAQLGSAVERLSASASERDARLRHENADVHVVLDAVSDGILQLDAAGRIVRANPAAVSLLGLSSPAIGQPIATLVRNVELRNVLQQSALAGASVAAELSLNDRRLLASARPLTDGAGRPGGVVIAFTDLTEMRRLESVRRDFVANASHELKTPLTSIRGYVETLLTDDALPADVRHQFLEVVHKNADRLHHIVDDLLDLSRLESGGWRPRIEPCDAGAIISDVAAACSAAASARNIQLVIPRGAVPVRADPAGLRQVLSNLLENALRYTPEGGRVELTVHETSQRNGNGRAHAYAVFEVRDNGVGIPSDALPRIFERFYRVDPARSRAEGGTGLGLAIVKHLVESMHGEVNATSELGKGTTVSFRLPAAS